MTISKCCTNIYEFPLSFYVSRYPDYPGPFNVNNNDKHKNVFPSLKDVVGSVCRKHVEVIFCSVCMSQYLRERQVYSENNSSQRSLYITTSGTKAKFYGFHKILKYLFLINTGAWTQQCKENSQWISGRLVSTETLLLFVRGASREKIQHWQN